MQEQPELPLILQESLAVEAKQQVIDIKSTWSTRKTINNINGTLIDYRTYNQTSVNFFLANPVLLLLLICYNVGISIIESFNPTTNFTNFLVFQSQLVLWYYH